MNERAGDGDPDAFSPEVSSQISAGIVALYAKLYGRGPEAARSYVHEDYVLTVLDGSFTLAERTLVEAGNCAQVEETRRAFQDAVREDFVAVVTDVTGRSVTRFLSQIHVPSETAVELFLLAPSNGGSTDL